MQRPGDGPRSLLLTLPMRAAAHGPAQRAPPHLARRQPCETPACPGCASHQGRRPAPAPPPRRRQPGTWRQKRLAGRPARKQEAASSVQRRKRLRSSARAPLSRQPALLLLPVLARTCCSVFIPSTATRLAPRASCSRAAHSVSAPCCASSSSGGVLSQLLLHLLYCLRVADQILPPALAVCHASTAAGGRALPRMMVSKPTALQARAEHVLGPAMTAGDVCSSTAQQ